MAKLIFPTDDDHARALSRKERAGELKRVRQGVYTDAKEEDIPDLVINRWYELVDHLCTRPIAVFRTAAELRPTNGRVYVAADVVKARNLKVGEWLTIVVTPGKDFTGTEPFAPGVYRSAIARQLLENLVPARTRDGNIKVLGQEWVEEELCKILKRRGEDALNATRDEARSIADKLGFNNEFKQLDTIVGALLASQPVEGALSRDLATAVAKREPYDPNRIERFGELSRYLGDIEFEPVTFEFNTAAWRNLSFFESYFSNFIEGTEFLIDEAEDIVFSDKLIENRHADSHDVLAVYRMVHDHQEMLIVPESADHLLELLQSRHALMMEQRPDKNPGTLKAKTNKAGNTVFVSPEELTGTLTRGFEIYQELAPGLARAIFIQFLVSECHPFDDGNGRLSRVFLNAELVSQDQHKIIVPTVARENYLNALREATRSGRFRTLVKVFFQLQKYTASIPWIDYGDARQTLEEHGADQLPDSGIVKFNRQLKDYQIKLK